MLILSIRTDKPTAEIGLFDNKTELAYSVWPAHRQLAESIHLKIQAILDSQQKTLTDLDGVAIFKGPGSFTGLRIGLSVANALATSLKIPIVSAAGPTWLSEANNRLLNGENEEQAMPDYGAPPKTTKQRK